MMRIGYEAWAVALRELKTSKTFVKYVLGLVFITAAIFFIGLGFDKIINFTGYGVKYSEFFSSGIILFYVAMIGLHAGTDVIADKRGFVKLLLVSPVSKYSILLGRIISAFIMSLRTFFIVGVVFLILFNKFSIVKVLIMLLLLLFVTLAYTGFGLWLASLFDSKKTLSEITSYLMFFFLFFSGVFYPIQTLPKLLQPLFYLNPLTYSIDIFRIVTLGTGQMPLILDMSVVVLSCLFFVFLGTWYFDKKMRK